jgi:uncharacterized DUF497 family protein
MGLEWDEKKNRANIAEHGVDFRDAALIFDNPVIQSEDNRIAYGGRRYRALGYVDDVYFMVAFTWRGENRRIITAWKVDGDGKRRYQAILSRPS